jgi:hypothetical protein
MPSIQTLLSPLTFAAVTADTIRCRNIKTAIGIEATAVTAVCRLLPLAIPAASLRRHA